jgi:amphiphysin
MHDEKLKDLIPSILDSISSFFHPILQTLYSIQLSLYQHLYASLHEYAVSQGLSNTDSVVDECLHMYEPVRQKAETEIKSLREGKTAKIPVGETGMGKPGLFARRTSQGTGLGGLGKSKPPPPPPPAAPPAYSTHDTGSQRPSIKSSGSYGKTPPPPPSGSPKPKPSSSTLLSANLGRQPSYGIPAGRTPSTSSVTSINSLHSLNTSNPLNSVNPLNSMNGKKKPPPPPAPKPSLTPKPEFVVAKYDFAGESEGDLQFSVGDRIKVLKKTESLDDWWEGERNGQRGMFPRNYCE